MIKSIPVIITVERCPAIPGYQLRHNQFPGFKGIIEMTWTWFKYRKDARDHAKELEKCWNS